jgi:hypothetical protein
MARKLLIALQDLKRGNGMTQEKREKEFSTCLEKACCKRIFSRPDLSQNLEY